MGTVRSQQAPSASIRNPKEAQVFAFDSCSKSTKTVGVSSTARRKRNHDSSGTCRTNRGEISLRSTAINPNPPPCKTKSVARKVCSIFLQRTHKISAVPPLPLPRSADQKRPLHQSKRKLPPAPFARSKRKAANWSARNMTARKFPSTLRAANLPSTNQFQECRWKRS